jgi:hypothetical protein
MPDSMIGKILFESFTRYFRAYFRYWLILCRLKVIGFLVSQFIKFALFASRCVFACALVIVDAFNLHLAVHSVFFKISLYKSRMASLICKRAPASVSAKISGSAPGKIRSEKFVTVRKFPGKKIRSRYRHAPTAHSAISPTASPAGSTGRKAVRRTVPASYHNTDLRYLRHIYDSGRAVG